MAFPQSRPRRLRATAAARRLVHETTLTPADLIQPFFVRSGRGVRVPVKSMPGVCQLSVDQVVRDAREIFRLGVPAVILFGLPDKKDAVGSDAVNVDGVLPRAVRALKDALPDLLVITDLCLCEYTDHGHCGLVKKDGKRFHIDNDATLDRLAHIAAVQAGAGADWVAPSGMMDGAVGAIRRALDESGRSDVAILSYAVKYASAFYGPFRDAAQSAPAFGDRNTHQMDPANVREALREALLDVEEGADLLMVKPALSYLDVLSRLRERVTVPLAAYNVSGEYAMVKAAAAQGRVDESRMIQEILLSMKRAGADMILTYHARDAARALGG